MARESTFTNMTLTLLVVTFVCAIALGYVYTWTKEPIAQARLATQLAAIGTVMPGYDNNPVDEKFWIRNGSDSLECFPAQKNGKSIGVAIKSVGHKGYSGDVWLMVGLDSAGIIQNIVVIEHKETPGLGSKMTGDKFLGQFLGKNPGTTDFRVKKDGGTIDGISGATISSRAFIDAVLRAYKTYRDHGKEAHH